MKPTGRSPVPLTDIQRQAAELYLTSDKGYNEIAKAYGVSKSTLQYWVKKCRKEQINNEENTNGNETADT